MEKLKWKYDKKGKEWYVIESVPYANDGFTIKKTEYGGYELEKAYRYIRTFNKLKNAKIVAQLLRHG